MPPSTDTEPSGQYTGPKAEVGQGQNADAKTTARPAKAEQPGCGQQVAELHDRRKIKGGKTVPNKTTSGTTHMTIAGHGQVWSRAMTSSRMLTLYISVTKLLFHMHIGNPWLQFQQ